MSANQKMIVNTPGVGLMYKSSAGALTMYATLLLVKVKVKNVLSPASAAGGENVDYSAPDGSIVRFPKFGKVISGVDDTDITPATSSTTASGYGEMAVTVAEAPDEFTSMTAFVKDLEAEKDTKFLLVFPTGFTYKGQVQATVPVADGWVYMLGKRSTDLEMDYAEGVKEVALTFLSNTDSTLATADFTGITMPAIDWRAGATTLTPATLISGDGTNLIAGKVVTKPTTYV